MAAEWLMNVHRFYCEKITEPVVELAGPEARHLASVLRLQKGQQVELFDGRGAAGMAAIKTITDKMIILDVKSLRLIPQRTTGRIILAVSIAKGERFDWLVEKCTELGIDRLCPVLFERTVKSAAGSQIQQRWKRLAISAAKQSGRYFLPVIDSPASLTDILNTLRMDYPSADILLGQPQLDALPIIRYPFSGKDYMVFVGPEGGLADSEQQLLLECGAKTVRLTDTILRVETAALAFASILAAMRDSLR
jgi:16S rRNA (uracil1498-N3)-methyltransferase